MPDTTMQDEDAEREDQMMYGNLDEAELAANYPNRPHNHSKSLSFHILHSELFKPLLENRKRPASTGPAQMLKKTRSSKQTPTEIRTNIIRRFISRWRSEVGDDVYPAFRLIVPDQDRERAMYGLKEKAIAPLLISVMGINKKSADANALLEWKLPGSEGITSAGDFATRCYEVLAKRPMRTEPSVITLAEVNAKLDQLSMLSKQQDQIPIFRYFYREMNPEEFAWLIRIILRQMKLGATEKTLFYEWHPDAISLFNVSSSLRRVCWELVDPEVRLPIERSHISLMSCFQPQLAMFQLKSFEEILSKMRPEEKDDEFWIEEKVDGERMQLHMMEDSSVPGGFRFKFWSRKAKDYTYLYGSGLEDVDSSLTKYLKDAFDHRVRNIILDGEMISWNMEVDAVIPFGHLKTAALEEIKNPYSNTQRPVFRIFDCLYLNDKPLTPFYLRKRREALLASVKPIHRRFEIHDYISGRTVADIETSLKKVIAESSEGLVIKSPRSAYRMNERNDDWIKVKPEYMDEYGEDLDCLIIGGYYGSGHRGGNISSFLCGLRPPRAIMDDTPFFWSFLKVGGGFAASDYQEIYSMTEGKWQNWDLKKSRQYMELAGDDRPIEKPDVWIKPEDSIVISVKAASTHTTNQFRTGITVRFPRFKAIRSDRNWESALTVQEFQMLKARVEREHNEKELKISNERRTKRAKPSTRTKKTIQLSDAGSVMRNPYGAADVKIFDGMTFFVTSGSSPPNPKSKGEIEATIKSHGGTIVQKHAGHEKLIVIGEKKNLKTGPIEKNGKFNVIKPQWVFDCITQSQIDAGKQASLLPLEPAYMHFTKPSDLEEIEANVDQYGDSYCRDLTAEQLGKLCDAIKVEDETAGDMATQFEEFDLDMKDYLGVMFYGVVAYLDHPDQDVDLQNASHKLMFASGIVETNLTTSNITHVLIGNDQSRVDSLRRELAQRQPMPRIVSLNWVLDSWREQTRLDSERYAL